MVQWDELLVLKSIGGAMKIGLHSKFRMSVPKAVLFSAALTLIFAVPANHAQSASQLDKHARKIEKRLTKYRTGTFLEVDLRDSSATLGALGDLSDTSFQLTSSDNNRKVTFSYAEVAHVKKGKEYIGAGSEPTHHARLWMPVLIGAATAGAGVGVYEALR